MANIPLHLQILRALERRLEERRRVLQEKTGRGLPDQDYQRHVGRIAEVAVALQMVEQLMAGGQNLVEDEEEALREQARERRAQARIVRGH